MFQAAETQRLHHTLELQEKEKSTVEAERLNLQKEAQLEQQVCSSGGSPAH